MLAQDLMAATQVLTSDGDPRVAEPATLPISWGMLRRGSCARDGGCGCGSSMTGRPPQRWWPRFGGCGRCRGAGGRCRCPPADLPGHPNPPQHPRRPRA